ncbi:MAG TPA: TetR family transcriptional regulator [Candidatus Binataceae bacterium]|jgi:TetR/AcrR family fatty acid metabolism transcriptional regulator
MASSREELIKEYRVNEILEAARRVIGRHGFEGTTIDRVAEEARIAKGTIYLYFPKGKVDLLHAAVFEGLRAIMAETHKLDRPQDPPLERVRHFVLGQFRILSSHQDFLKAFELDKSFVTFAPGDALGEKLRSLLSEYLDYAASILEAAARGGAIRPVDPKFAAFILSEMTTACLRRRLIGLADTPVEDDAEALLDLFLRGVQAAPCG